MRGSFKAAGCLGDAVAQATVEVRRRMREQVSNAAACECRWYTV